MPVRPPTFRHKGARTTRQRNADHDQRRGSARERGYGARWDSASLGFKRAHPLCLGCEAVGRVAATYVTDHVVPHKGDMVVFWDRTRWQPSCRWHHDVIKQQLEAMYGKGSIGIEALWLNSAKAIELTLHHDPRGGG